MTRKKPDKAAKPREKEIDPFELLKEVGPPERYQHGDEIGAEAVREAGDAHVIVFTQDALDRYYRRSQLDADTDMNRTMYDAGVRLRGDYFRAGISPNVVAPYNDFVPSDSVRGISNIQVEAYRRWRKAVDAIGDIANDVVITVCCEGKPIGRENMILLRRGLGVLVKHYGY